MSKNISSNNKRIAKNTMLLYLRMFLTMAITLFTSRVILRALGVEDYGIYNVVGGVVAMMGVLNNAMAVAAQRYLTFEIGRNNIERLNLVFNISIIIYMLLSIILLILAETVGLWFLNTQLVIPEERMVAANWVYQFSIISCIVGLMLAPYNASIIAHEEMGVYAYVSIADSVLKLGIVYLLYVSSFDKLISYGALNLLVVILIAICYYVFCHIKFKECRFKFLFDKSLFKELLSYSGWNVFGSAASLVKGQGVNVLLNMFFTPAVNAARGIAYQVNAAVSVFFTNFYTAVRPQITKYYAQEDMKNMILLVFRSTKMACFLIVFLSIPIIVETPFIVKLWLGIIPDYVVPFIRIIMLITMIDSMSNPLMTTAHATGRIKAYQFVVGMMNIMILPISYVALKMGAEPVSVFIISLVMSVLCFGARMIVVNRLIDFPVKKYIIEVLFPCFLVTVLSVIPPIISHHFLQSGWQSVIITVLISVFSTILCVYFIGLNRVEKNFISSLIKTKLHR